MAIQEDNIYKVFINYVVFKNKYDFTTYSIL